MLQQRRASGEQVARKLFIAEASLSDTLTKVADLVSTTQIARRSANLSAVVGSDAVTRAISCMKALGDAHQELVAAHHSLAETQKEVGLGRVRLDGDGDYDEIGTGGGDKPKGMGEAPASVTSVAA